MFIPPMNSSRLSHYLLASVFYQYYFAIINRNRKVENLNVSYNLLSVTITINKGKYSIPSSYLDHFEHLCVVTYEIFSTILLLLK